MRLHTTDGTRLTHTQSYVDVRQPRRCAPPRPLRELPAAAPHAYGGEQTRVYALPRNLDTGVGGERASERRGEHGRRMRRRRRVKLIARVDPNLNKLQVRLWLSEVGHNLDLLALSVELHLRPSQPPPRPSDQRASFVRCTRLHHAFAYRLRRGQAA